MCIICSRLLVALCWGELRRCLLSSDGEFEFILFLCSSCSLSLCWLAHAPPSTDGVSKCTSSMGSGMLGFRSRSWSTFELLIPLFEKLLLIPSCSAILKGHNVHLSHFLSSTPFSQPLYTITFHPKLSCAGGSFGHG